jgi:hypothetical protein
MDLDLNRGKYIQMAALDFSKAFDRLQPGIVLDKMYSYGFNSNVVRIVKDFLSNRKQCVRISDQTSDYVDIGVGAPQGTKLGPLLWLIYVNDLSADGFSVVKYADDTTFYQTIKDSRLQSVSPAILTTQAWSEANNMLLNTTKTTVMNVSINFKYLYDQPVLVGNEQIVPSDSVKFLGVTIDNHLTFSAHVNNLVSKCNAKLFLMRQLRSLGMNRAGLLTLYCTNIRSILTYASPACFFMLSGRDRVRLEAVQYAATKIMHPDLCREERLSILCLPTLSDFIFSQGSKHFMKIANSPEHPLFNRISFNTNRTSSRLNSTYRPHRARTSKRQNSFMHFFMTNT